MSTPLKTTRWSFLIVFSVAPVMTELFFIQRLDMYLGLEWAADFVRRPTRLGNIKVKQI